LKESWLTICCAGESAVRRALTPPVRKDRPCPVLWSCVDLTAAAEMSLTAGPEVGAIPAAHAGADSLAGTAASPAALKRMSKALRDAPRSRQGLGQLSAALEAVRGGDLRTGTTRALAALKMDERNGLAWHILAI